jgi:hypothetical protein
VLIRRRGGTLRAVQLGIPLDGVVLLRIPVPVGVSLVRIGLAAAFLVVGLLIGLVTVLVGLLAVLRPRITPRALRTSEDLVPPETFGGLRTLAFIPLEALATLLGVSVTAVSLLLWPGHLPLVILALALVIRTLIILLGISAVVVSTTGIRPAVLTWAGVRTADILTGIRPAV